MFTSLFTKTLRRVPARAFMATLHHPEHVVAGGSPAFLFGFAATFLVLSAIAFAPEHDFDDLDCQAYCEVYCVDPDLCHDYTDKPGKSK